MKKISIFALIITLLGSTIVTANEVNIFNARHYKADAELMESLLQQQELRLI